MKRKTRAMLKMVVISLTIMLMAFPPVMPQAKAGGYVNGTVSTDGNYVYNNGYWWNNGRPYYREQYKSWYTSNCCRYYKLKWRYKAVAGYSASSTYGTPSEDWRETITKASAAKKQYEYSLKASALEHNEWLEAMHAAGLTGGGYDYNPAYANAAYYRSAYASPYALQGNTAYGVQVQPQGYSVKERYSSYGDSDLNLWVERYSEGVKQLNTAALQSNSGFKELISEEAKNKSMLVEQQLKADMARQVGETFKEMMRAGELQQRSTYEREQSYIGPAQQGVPKPEVYTGKEFMLSDALQSNLKARCYSCHDGTSPSYAAEKVKGWDLSKWAAYDYEQWRHVCVQVTEGHMPPDDAPSLTVEELVPYLGYLKYLKSKES